MMLTVASFLIACEFTAGMYRLKADVVVFFDSRRHFLSDPAKAAAEHCAQHITGEPAKKQFCRLAISIRTDSVWDDVCLHSHASTFRVERFYKITMTCRTSVFMLPSFDDSILVSLVKR